VEGGQVKREPDIKVWRRRGLVAWFHIN
jgi:hypothetical protein